MLILIIFFNIQSVGCTEKGLSGPNEKYALATSHLSSAETYMIPFFAKILLNRFWNFFRPATLNYPDTKPAINGGWYLKIFSSRVKKVYRLFTSS